MSDKIWLIKSGKRLHLNEADMLRRTNARSARQEILEYELKSSQKSSDYYKTKDRDNQLKTVLGELDKSEISILNLINLYDKYTPDGKKHSHHLTNEVLTEKSVKIENLRKYQNSKSEISRILINEKSHFLSISNSVEWLTAVLSCHNFNNHI